MQLIKELILLIFTFTNNILEQQHNKQNYYIKTNVLISQVYFFSSYTTIKIKKLKYDIPKYIQFNDHIQNYHILSIFYNNNVWKKNLYNSNQTLQINCSNASYHPLYQKAQSNMIHKMFLNSSDEIKENLPKSIKNQFYTNQNLLNILEQQNLKINNIILKKKTILLQITKVNNTLSKIFEQCQWLSISPDLGEILQIQISKLPKTSNFKKLNKEISAIKIKRLKYEKKINTIPLILAHSKQDDNTSLTEKQKKILITILSAQNDLINSLLKTYDIQIIELTKLKIAHIKLQDGLKKIQQAKHRYLFWFADIYPVTISYPIEILQDLYKIYTKNILNTQIIPKFLKIFQYPLILTIIIFIIILFIKLHYKIYYRYQEFLKKSSLKIGKVNQDNFLLTFYNIWYSLLIALPLPILWKIIGYFIGNFWSHPIIIYVVNAINSTVIILWIFIINAYFASPQGLFISHFGWPIRKIKQVFSKYYILSISIIIFLIIMFTIFNNYNEREFANTIGRLCFIILCTHLTCIAKKLKNSGLPLYINKNNSSKNIINYSLWYIIIFAPILSAVACIYGYLSVAQELLQRLETSLLIWITLLIIYHIIRRWISIQRRRVDFIRAKQKRAKKIALRTHIKSNFSQEQIHHFISTIKNNKKTLDLDIINTQSLQLIRSILTLVAILLMTLLWSELRSAFSFLENITLWDVTSTIQGVNNIQPITLYSLLIACLVIIITTKTVHHLPALLELTILQHLDLTPGTGYAITTLTKYTLMLLGGIIGCSLIGIEWTKIQWLIAALGVGLGFGLQEIFANFISGLMILFEKPIRIGDTITIHNLTGNVTRINTRATTITDLNHKEIIIPNKEFITKKFINWSLSNTITRVVLKVAVPMNSDMKMMTEIFLRIIQDSPLALTIPLPEVYIVDFQIGLPIFEIRVYVAHTKLRMPLLHQIHIKIISYYQKNKIEIPFFINYLNYYQTSTKNSSSYSEDNKQ